MISTDAFRTLNNVEHARQHPEATIEIVKETSRLATIKYDVGYDRGYRTLSKRNKSEASALNIVRKYLSGELPRYA